MGLMDAFNPEATTELKVGELYRMLQQAAENETTAKFLMNGVKNEVPYRFIREVVTGEKVDDEKDPITISIDEETAGHIAGMFGDMLGAHIEAIKDPCEGCDHFDECHPSDGEDEEPEEDNGEAAAGAEDPAAGDEDFDPLPFPEVCKNEEENKRYHSLAKCKRSELEHIAYGLGVQSPECYKFEGLLNQIIERERKAGREEW